jgi:hypothetical protein
MRSQAKLFITTAVVELGAGLALMSMPALAIRLMFDIAEPSPEALMIGRVGAAALLAIGIACWLAKDDNSSRSQRGLLWGMLTYNVGACIVLAASGLIMQMAGSALGPAVVLHITLTIWCGANLRAQNVANTLRPK